MCEECGNPTNTKQEYCFACLDLVFDCLDE